ncbi:MAG: hypothetical protein WC343_04745 [Bacilli bacterium]|jgi:phosphoribosylpyrophosphate synthetase
MSLSQIRQLDKIVKKRRFELQCELKILEIKKNIYNKFQMLMDDIVDTYEDIVRRFTYNNKNLAYAKRK